MKKKKICDHCNEMKECINVGENVCKECVEIFNDGTSEELKINWSEYNV